MNYRDVVLRSRPFLYVPDVYGAGNSVSEVVGRRTTLAYNGAGVAQGLIAGEPRGPSSDASAGSRTETDSDASINNALLGTFTMSIWFAYTSSGTLYRMVGKAGTTFPFGVLINYHGNVAVEAGWLTFYSRSGSDADALTFNGSLAGRTIYDGRPHRLTLIRSGTAELRGLIDGVFLASRVPAGVEGSNTSPLVVAHDGTGAGANRWPGRSGHFTLYDRALSVAEDRELYNAGKGLWLPGAPTRHRCR